MDRTAPCHAMVHPRCCQYQSGSVSPMTSSPGRRSFDQALKGILLRGHDGVLALVAPDLTFRGERSPELPAVARRADVVWEVADAGGQPGGLHIEVQTEPDAQIGERLAEYR